MSDLLVRLYALPASTPVVEGLAGEGIVVRRAAASERSAVVAFAREHGSEGWASECEAAFSRLPITCFVAVDSSKSALIGFACTEAAARGFFGPELVHPDHRGRGIGRALLLVALQAMRADGYGYAIVGWAAPGAIDFYRRAVGAVMIEGSEPGIYPPPLRG